MTNFLRLCTLFLLLFGCGNPTPVIKKEKEKLQEYSLGKDDLYSGDKIQLFLRNKLKKTQESNRLFLKGLNSYKNDQNLDSAEYYLIQSILKEPTSKAYYELGNVFLDKKKYDNTLKAYGLAEQLGFEPYSKILYNTACVFSLIDKIEMSGNYLEFAIQAGYSNLDNINKDPDLVNLRNSFAFEKAVKNGLKGMSEPEKLFWLQFKRLFPKLNKPIKLEGIASSIESDDLNFIAYDFEKYIAEMRDEKFSRDVSKGFYYYGLLAENENYVALIYMVKDEYMGESSPLTYRLATFDHSGILIDKREISGRTNLDEPIKVATIDAKMNIRVDLYETTYEKDPIEHGYYGNEIVSKQNIGSEKYKISTKGEIVEQNKKKEIASN